MMNSCGDLIIEESLHHVKQMIKKGGVMLVYDNIKMYAKAQNKSIRKVEEKAGLSNGVIGKWRSKSPRLSSLQKVADELGVSIGALLQTK